MKKMKQIQGKVMPLSLADVDTDLIIPAQYLTSVSKQGYGEHVFRRLRDQDANFVFNRPHYVGASILLALDNFGCGSSREHAVWALLQAGIQAIIAPSFADIFFNNAAKNGLVLISQPRDDVHTMMAHAHENVGDYHMTIDIIQQHIHCSRQQRYPFTLDPFHHYCFTQGVDDLTYLLAQQDRIAQHHAQAEDR